MPRVNLENFVFGLFAAMGANYVWEVLRIPPYGYRAFRLTTGTEFPNAHEVWLGFDDLLLFGIGVVIILAGRKHKELISFGLGWIIGIGLTKVFEVFQNPPSISPASFALPVPVK